MSNHPIDRAMRAIRPAIIGFAVLSAPVMLFTYAWGVKELREAMPLWAWLLVCLCHVTVWLGVAALADIRQEQRQK